MAPFAWKFKSIQQRLTVYIFVLITLLLLIATGAFYFISQNALRKSLYDQLTYLANTAAEMIDLGKHEVILRAEDVNRPEDVRLISRFKIFKDAYPDLRSICILASTRKPDALRFVFGIGEYGKPVHRMGEEFDISAYPEMQKAFETPTVDEQIVRNQNGYYLSGYAPVKDRWGNTAAIVWLVISADNLNREERQLKTADCSLLFWVRPCPGNFAGKLRRTFASPSRF